MTNDREKLFSATEASEYLGLTRQRIHYLAATGRIGQRVGEFWVFTKSELDQFNEERAKRPKGGGGKDVAGVPAVVTPA